MAYRLFDYETFIAQQDALIIEQVVGAEFWENPFFSSIAAISRQRYMKIYQVDPVNIKTTITDSLLGVAGGSLIINALSRNKAGPQQPSRREFLKNAAKVLGGISLFHGSTNPGFYMESIAASIHPKIRGYARASRAEYGIDDICQYGESDYRNIIIAEGIERCCHLLKEPKKLGCLHGAMHWRTVHFYLEHPRVRKKRLAYFPFDSIANTSIREYAPTRKGWKLTRSIPTRAQENTTTRFK